MRLISFLLVGIIAAGTALRVSQYFQQDPLTRDEMALALNLGARSPMELLRPLDYEQVAAPLFLLIEDAAAQIGGLTPLALRLFPLIVGLLVPWLVWLLARQFVDVRAALLATALAALSTLLVLYATEARPHGMDAGVGCVLTLLALRVSRQTGPFAARSLLGASLVSLVLSVAAPFVIASCYLGLLLKGALRVKQIAVHGCP